MKFRSVKGTRDILPDESHRWQFVEQSIRAVMQLFNYREIRTPLFEETAMFSRSIGELTDIVGKEMYTFTDRSGTSLTLKPEMTASVIRAYIQHNLGEAQPLVKVYYIAPMFRQERPQAGRFRQFHQFGAEAIGGESPAIDADIIALSSQVYTHLGIRSVAIRINSVGCEKCRPPYKELLTKFLTGVRDQLSEESRRRLEQNPLRILDSKDEGDRALTRDAPLMKDHLCPECAGHFNELQRILLSIGIEFEVDGRIVRGLDYYTKTAFEIISTDLGAQDALAGGGRYDLLVKELGGKETPGVGFAAGMERLLMVMEKQKASEVPPAAPLLFIASADEDGKRWATRTVIELRRAGVAAEADLLGRSLKAQMREADRQRAGFVIVVGSDELRRNEGSLKDMRTGGQRLLALDQLASLLSAPPDAR